MRPLAATGVFSVTLKELGKDDANREALLGAVVQFLFYEGSKLSEPVHLQWQQLKQEFTGTGFSAYLRRYVGMNLLEDEFDAQGHRIDQSREKIRELAGEAFKNSDLLKPELHWLMSNEAKNGYLFGYELGKIDTQFSLLPMLLEYQRQMVDKASVFFLGGYFRALLEVNEPKWEVELDALASDRKMVVWVPELTWRSGLNDRAAQRVLDLAQGGLIAVTQFRMFCLGSDVRDLSEEMFKKWIMYLVENPDKYAAAIALDMYDFYYLRKDTTQVIPEDLTFNLLTHSSLLGAKDSDTMVDYHWTEVAKAFIERYPNRSMEFASKIFERETGGLVMGYMSSGKSILTEIARQHPREMWELVSKHLQAPLDSRSYHILTWLQGRWSFDQTAEPGAISIMPASAIWYWVEQDEKERASLIAHFVPKHPFRAINQVCPREVLARYGHYPEVQSSLNANFYTEGWSGPRSLHYQRKKEELLEYKLGETNSNVIAWIDSYIEGLEKQIEFARVEEEREGR